jgi:hypothetical protein
MTDDEIAKEVELQILGDKCFLDCGCFIKKICTHPNGELVLLDEELEPCPLHQENPREWWHGQGYYDLAGRRKTWLHKKDGEVASTGWWTKSLKNVYVETTGNFHSLEGTHLINIHSSVAVRGT